MLVSTLLVSLVAVLPLAGDEPSPEALFARFRDNARAFATLRVQWRRDSRRSDDGVAAEVARIAGLERRLAGMDPSQREFHTLNAEANARRQGLAANYGPQRMFQTYLADKSQFMMRIAPANWDVLQRSDAWLMPDAPVTEETMRSKYNGFTLIAHGNPAAPGFRTCTPMGGGAVGVMVQRQMVVNKQNYFPPLAMGKADFGPDSLRHPIDTFFAEGPKGLATTGRASVGGREAVVVEGRMEIPRRGGQPPRVEFVRAYLDAERGALPLRIEWFDEARKSARPVKVLETTEIRSVGGGFYPAKGSVRLYGPDPSGPADTDAYVILEETTWEAAKIEASLPPGESFVLPIPKGTYYYDEFRGTTVQAGQEGVSHTRLPWSLCGVLLACWAAYGATVLVRAVVARRRSGSVAKSSGAEAA